MQTSRTAAVDLYWIPLGAGGHSVRFNGRVFEAIEAARQHRKRCDLYHAALVIELDGDRYTIEIAPSPDADEASRGVVATGAVGSRYIGWLRLFRYEVRRWRGGSIPDLGEAVGGPCRVSSDPGVARRALELVAVRTAEIKPAPPIEVAGLTFTAVHTPGHTSNHTCFAPSFTPAARSTSDSRTPLHAALPIAPALH